MNRLITILLALLLAPVLHAQDIEVSKPVLFAKAPVKTKNEKKVEVERYYYLDIKKAIIVKADIGDAIVSVSADRTILKNFGKTIDLDLRSRELEFAQDMFPLNEVFEAKSWFYGWRDYWKPNGFATATSSCYA